MIKLYSMFSGAALISALSACGAFDATDSMTASQSESTAHAALAAAVDDKLETPSIGSESPAEPEQEVGACDADSKCPDGLCCSQYDFCGSGPAYCGPGCKSGPCEGGGGIITD
ncbi:hypothetical protein WME88_30135 [Sorangium sp. So ce216]